MDIDSHSMSAPATSATLVEDLNEIKAYLETQDTLCETTIKAFISRYDVLGQAALIRPAASVFRDRDLLELLLDCWIGLIDPVTFVKFIYTFCLLGTYSKNPSSRTFGFCRCIASLS